MAIDPRPSADPSAADEYYFGKELFDLVQYVLEILLKLCTNHIPNSESMMGEVELLLAAHVYQEGDKHYRHHFSAAAVINEIFEESSLVVPNRG